MISLSQIASDEQLENDLAWPFDFSISEADDDTAWVCLNPPKPFRIIAGEGAGGSYIAYGDEPVELRTVLYASSEGQFGKIAQSLAECIAILLALPYWQDLLKFSGGGKLDEMRITETHMKTEYREDYPDLDDAKRRIEEKLDLPVLTDPIATLHDNIQSTECVMLARDGYNWESLFNTFSPSDNPNWR